MFVLYVDTANLAAGDVVELRIKEPVLASGTTRVLHYAAFYGAQRTDDILKVSVPVVSDSVAGGLVFTLKQTFGTGRVFAWRVNLLA